MKLHHSPCRCAQRRNWRSQGTDAKSIARIIAVKEGWPAAPLHETASHMYSSRAERVSRRQSSCHAAVHFANFRFNASRFCGNSLKYRCTFANTSIKTRPGARSRRSSRPRASASSTAGGSWRTAPCWPRSTAWPTATRCTCGARLHTNLGGCI